MPRSQPYDVFLSYTMHDRAWVAAFADSLRAAGVNTWFDVSALGAGDRWENQIQDALRESRFVVVILSSHSISSSWMFFELGAAVGDRKRVIPVVMEDVELGRIPELLRQFPFVKERSPTEAGKQVAATIKAARGSRV